MGCEEKKPDLNLSKLVVQKKSKGNFYSKKPVFCENGNSIAIPSGPAVYLFNTDTGNLVKKLFQSSDNIISCQLHPLQDSLLVIFSENGELTVFNLKTGEVEYSVELKIKNKILNKQNAPKFDSVKGEGKKFDWETQPLDSLSHRRFYYAEAKCFHDNPSEIYVWASWCLSSEFQCHLSAFTLKGGKHIRLIHMQNSGLRKSYLNFAVKTIYNYNEAGEVFVGNCSEYVQIIFYDSQRRPFSVKHYLGIRRTITCLAFHPTECCFATGDTSGKIVVWKNIFEKHPLKSEMHWHKLPVGDLFFSKFGNFLFSGGEETVLVKWALNSKGRDFLPRLSSSIFKISGHSESSLLCVSTVDDKVQILNFNFNSISTIQNFSKWAIHKQDKKCDIFTIDPRSNSLVLNAKTGHIQFLSIKEEGKLIYTFDVTDRNLIADADKVMKNVEVTHARLSKDGKWLFTYESRWDKGLKESRLKFWWYSHKHSSFTLNTNVEFPHNEFLVHCLEVSSDDMLATSGGDEKFRVWTLFEYEERAKTKVHWALHAVNKYKRFPCHGLDFSKDASLLAVTFGPVLTVWDTESSSLKCSLSVPYNKDSLKFCKFGNFELSHILVASTEHMISSWNLITLSMLWSVPLRVSLLISDPFSIYMAVFSADNHLVIFSPSSPTPDLIVKKVCDCPVLAAHCIPAGPGKFSLYFLNANQELFSLEDGEKAPVSYSDGPVKTVSTPFTAQLAEIRNQNELDSSNSTSLTRSKTCSVSALLDAPAHTLPNPSALCLDVLKGLVLVSGKESANPSSAKLNRHDFVSKTNKISAAAAAVADVDTDEVETDLLSIVKTIFV